MWTFFSLCQQSTYLLGLESVTRVWVGYLRGFWFGRGLAESVGFVWEWLHGLAPINQMVLNIRRLTSQTGGLFVNVLVCEPLRGGKSAGVCRCHWGYITLHMTRDIPQVKHTRWNVYYKHVAFKLYLHRQNILISDNMTACQLKSVSIYLISEPLDQRCFNLLYFSALTSFLFSFLSHLSCP